LFGRTIFFGFAYVDFGVNGQLSKFRRDCNLSRFFTLPVTSLDYFTDIIASLPEKRDSHMFEQKAISSNEHILDPKEYTLVINQRLVRDVWQEADRLTRAKSGKWLLHR
jgi:hypothetical protein